ncbi:TetR/AcrR family transcriptional regulator [Propionispora vibrioides]|uniref:DNA-binding transcriptional regulator, AcrR family n=1 Tax=Propionispora vibrioides TaxID=112903 RepID=A0A1H8XUG7_9FIRM|nr:TetR/AcrR family transcriptional regulator [Propionispora vibrioides]SEP42958.1 DNA-binding transcriptional regulator, AcrR family [Propionispora vibrioides]
MEDVKLSILSAAKIRFSRFGFQKTTINEICRDCRISKRTLYQQFPNKEELFMCLITHELEKLKAMVLTQTQNLALPVYQLSQLLQTIGVYFYENRSLLYATIKQDNTIHSLGQTNRFQTAVEKEISALIAKVILEGKQQCQFRNIDEHFVACIGFNLLQSLFITNKVLTFSDKTAVNEYTREFIDLFVNGIANEALFSKNQHPKTDSTL